MSTLALSWPPAAWKSPGRVLRAAARWFAARWQLRRARELGARVRVRGRLQVEGVGSLEIGDGVSFHSHLSRTQLSVGPGALLRIGDGTFVNHGAILSAHSLISIGRDCQLGPQVVVMDSDFHAVGDLGAAGKSAPIVIEDGVWLATRAMVLRGVRIGRGAVVAAGAVVTKDVPAGSLVAGVPAQVVRRIGGEEAPR